MEKICVCCCYNRYDILKNMLLEGIERQEDVEVELRTIDCTEKNTNAAHEFNLAVQKIQAEFVVFVHQDVRFEDSKFLKRAIDFIKLNPKSVVGLVGVKKEGKKICGYSNMYHGLQNRNIGIPIEQAVEVTSLDEVMIGGLTETFRKNPFDEINFNGWHVYVADYCLSIQKIGYKVYVLPLKSTHKNAMEMPRYMKIIGILPKDYFLYFNRLVKKHRKAFDYIITPCMSVKSSFLLSQIQIMRRKSKNNFNKILRKLSLKGII